MPSAPKPPSASSSSGGVSGGGEEEGGKDAAVAKTAGFVVFSGIAMSIIKALTPQPHKPQPQSPPSPSPPPPPPPPVQKSPAMEEGFGSGSSSARTVEIVRGDTLWGLSRKHGVSIDAIKEANGLTGDTIYAGKKLVIP